MRAAVEGAETEIQPRELRVPVRKRERERRKESMCACVRTFVSLRAEDKKHSERATVTTAR